MFQDSQALFSVKRQVGFRDDLNLSVPVRLATAQQIRTRQPDMVQIASPSVYRHLERLRLPTSCVHPGYGSSARLFRWTDSYQRAGGHPDHGGLCRQQ
jgi:hypothetical protein